MSRADYVAQKIREAADHPKAPLLFAVGAERPTPQSAASEAYALGLTMQEERLAKWVAVGKRDSENLFGKPFLKALRDILKEGESEMKVIRGIGFFHAKTQPLLRKLVDDLVRAGVQFEGTNVDQSNTKGSGGLDNSLGVWLNSGYITIHESTKDGYGRIQDKLLAKSEAIREALAVALVTDYGLSPLTLRVSERKAMQPARAFARAWEAKSRQLKGSQEVEVKIYQDFDK